MSLSPVHRAAVQTKHIVIWSILVVVVWASVWFGLGYSSSSTEVPATRSMPELVEEIEQARFVSDTCRIMIDKPLRCLP